LAQPLFQWAMAVAFLAAAAMQLRAGRGRHRRAPWWLAAASLAAAVATLVGPMRALGWMSPTAASEAAVWLLVTWLGTLAWFVVAHTDGDGLRRGAALAVTLLLGLILIDRLPWPIGNAAPLGNKHAIPLVAATVILALLLADAAWRCWIARQRLSAIAFIGGMGIALLAIALEHTENMAMSLPDSALVAYLVALALLANDMAQPRRGGRDAGGPPRLVVVGELGAAIAHEINQPLGAILSNAEACDLLLQDGASPAELRVIMADIRRDAVRASEVIRQMRSLARRPELTLERIEANELVAGVIVLMTPDSRGRRIPIEGLASPSPAWLRIDRAQMQQVLINLVTNAMDAIESLPGVDGSSVMPPVVISVGSHEDEVVISVIDAGPGLPAEALERLFATFYTSKAHGMGLGLSIARSIVEAHGGRVQAENNPITGARFSVVLPADFD